MNDEYVDEAFKAYEDERRAEAEQERLDALRDEWISDNKSDLKYYFIEGREAEFHDYCCEAYLEAHR